MADSPTTPAAARSRGNNRRPAFNPGLLASPFYGGATVYGGAGAVRADSSSTRPSFYERGRSGVRPAPVSARDASAPVGRTARRIWDLLAHYSSPISDAKRAPAASVRTGGSAPSTPSTPSTPRLQPLRAPQMATLVSLKRNNRRVESAQAAIEASLSSSAPYEPTTTRPAVVATHSSKMKLRLTGRNRARDLEREAEMPTPVDLPNVSLNVTRLPDFLSTRPPLKRDRSPRPTSQTNGPVFAFAPPASPTRIEAPAKRFHFSDPLDADDPAAETLTTTTAKFGIGNFTQEKPRRLPETPSLSWNGVRGDDKNDKTDAETSSAPKTAKRQAESPATGFAEVIKKQRARWECSCCLAGNDNDVSKCACCDAPRPAGGAKDASVISTPVRSFGTTAPITLGLDSFVKKQKSQWECDSCLTRNDADKMKCVCCEVAKPGSTNANPVTVNAPPEPSKTSSSGFATFIQKQQSQWECSCCLARNDSTKLKCVCCEAAKPGSECAPSAAPQFNFGSPQTTTFKFGIDKADSPVTPVASSAVSEKIADKSKEETAPAPGFVFGIPSNSTPNPKSTESSKIEIKFGIPNGSVPIGSGKSETVTTVVPNLSFGDKKQTPSTSSAPSFNFGFNKSTATTTTVDSVTSPLPTFVSPLTKPPNSQNDTVKEKDEGKSPLDTPKVVQLPKNESPVTSPSILVSSITTTSTVSDVKPLFTFGSTISSSPSVFAPTSKFTFGSPASTAVVSKSDSGVPPLKSSGVLFSFGSKVSTPDSATESTTTANKPIFSLPTTNSPSLFPNSASPLKPQLKVPSPESSVKDAKPLVNSPFASPISSLAEKPKEQPASASAPAPVFNFTGSNPTSNTPPNIFKANANQSAPVFSFGATTTKADTNVPVFGSPQNTNNNIFGSQTVTGDTTKITNSNTFKPTTTFAPIAGSIFGSPSTTTATPQTPSTNLFGNTQPSENKMTNIFGSQLNASSMFNQNLTSPTFSGNSIFGSTSTNSATPSQSSNLFGSQPVSKTISSPPNIFGSNMSSGTTSGIFGSHPSVPTPLFGASIPFGESSQTTQPTQNVPFKFGENNSVQPPGFGQAPAAGSSAPVFSFGSSAQPVNTQFNFSMGIPPPAFPGQPGTNPGMAARRFKKAVRRNVPR